MSRKHPESSAEVTGWALPTPPVSASSLPLDRGDSQGALDGIL